MKKLIPALCMLLVAACLMGTSTYAWFSANKNVTASGMSVKAAAEGGLGIASYTNAQVKPVSTAFLTNATVDWNNHKGLTGKTISPASFNEGNWYTATATSVNAYGAATGNYSPVAAASLADFANVSRWQIKALEDGTTNALKVKSIQVTNAAAAGKEESTQLNKALRVAIKVGNLAIGEDGKETWTNVDWFYFAPSYNTAAGVQFTQATTTDGVTTYAPVANAAVKTGTVTTDDAKNVVTSTYTTSDTIIWSALTTAPIDVEVYVYYEGEDANCTSANAFAVDTLSVSIEYTIQ